MTTRSGRARTDGEAAFLAAALPVVERLLDRHDPERVSLTGLRPAEWSQAAACAGQVSRELDPWHPDEDTLRDRRAASALAREVCEGGCPVRAQCLALGLALIPLDGAHGMYGGFSPPELRAIQRARNMPERKVAQHGTRSRYTGGCECGPCRRAHNAYTQQSRAEARERSTSVGRAVAVA